MLNFSSCKLLIVNKRAHIYSENHRLAWVGSDPKEHTVPNPLQWEGMPPIKQVPKPCFVIIFSIIIWSFCIFGGIKKE